MSSPIPNYTHTDVKREKNKKLKFQYKKNIGKIYWRIFLYSLIWRIQPSLGGNLISRYTHGYNIYIYASVKTAYMATTIYDQDGNTFQEQFVP